MGTEFMIAKPVGQQTMKQKMADLLVAISWADLSRTYFGKSNSWLYHKMNGIDGNGKPTEFTFEEQAQLKGALFDLQTASAVLQNRFKSEPGFHFPH